MNSLRQHFPILSQQVNGKPLVYLDNAATTQKPQAVIDVVNELHTACNANIHRGIHHMAEQCTMRYEAARELLRGYVNAAHSHEIIFTAGTTAGINLVAFSFGERYVTTGDEIVVTEMEHHSNIVPWQLLCERKGARLRVLPMGDNGELQMDVLPSLLSRKTKLVAVAYASNVLGTINPVEEIIRAAHAVGAAALVDGAQAAPHGEVDVQKMGCDFFAFSGHKMYAPTGIGALYAKEKFLEEMPPYQGGGDMIKNVSFAQTTYADLPYKFEAGTSNYVGAIGLGEAVKFLSAQDFASLREHEQELLRYATQQLQAIDGLRIYGSATKKAPIVSFNLRNIHHLDAAQILDKLGIAVRSGTLCAEPLMQHYGVTGMLRTSLAFYNTTQEIEALVDGLRTVRDLI
jgi:cysteine desulfurase/selenocysteine lyase